MKEGRLINKLFLLRSKKGLFLLFLLAFLLVFLSSVSADERCGIKTVEECNSEEGVIVFRISGLTNAHGELQSYSNYEYCLCCSGSYDNKEIECRGENHVIALSSETNAHGEAYLGGFIYLNHVCYGDIRCGAKIPGVSDVNPNWEEVFSLSSKTNAHIGGPGDYDIPIHCNVEYWGTYCGDGIVQELNDRGQIEDCDEGDENCDTEGCTCYTNCTWHQYALEKRMHWAEGYTSKSEIDLRRNVIVGSTTVYMRIENAEQYDGINHGDAVEFYIYERDILSKDDEIRTGEDAIKGYWDGGNVVGNWTISDYDLEKTRDYDEFYFKSNVTGDERSGELKLILSGVDHCGIVYSCGDYDKPGDCGNDSGLCSVAHYSVQANNPNLDCSSDAIICGCKWDESAGVCDNSRGRLRDGA